MWHAVPDVQLIEDSSNRVVKEIEVFEDAEQEHVGHDTRAQVGRAAACCRARPDQAAKQVIDDRRDQQNYSRLNAPGQAKDVACDEDQRPAKARWNHEKQHGYDTKKERELWRDK